LHGNSNKSEEPPNGSANENVFDIKQGVAISACLATLARKAMATRLAECWGTRSEKYQFLNSKTLGTTSFCDLEPKAPNFYFVVPDTGKCAKEWDAWPSVAEIFTKRSTGTESGFDDLLVAFTRPELEARIHRFSDSGVSRIDLAKEFAFSEGHASELFDRRREMTTASSKEFRPFQLRAYDYRCAFLRKELLKTNSFNVMLDLSTETPGLVTTRQTKESFTAFAVSSFCGHKVTSSYDRSYVFPLFTTDHGSLMPTKVPCISRKALLQLKHLSHNASDIQLATDAFHYALAVMNAPAYRTLFCSQLKRDFPRLPMTGNLVLFRALARIGGELTALHLMKSPKLDSSITEFFGNRNIEVEKVSWSENTVWIDKARTTGFNGVREGVWHFCVGGYQVCEKWLKDRKGRRLSSEDRAHYQKIVVALSETIRLMAEIDAVIDEHGGWPAAFVVSSASSSKDKAMGNGEAIPQAAEDPASYSSGKTGDLGIVTDDELPLR